MHMTKEDKRAVTLKGGVIAQKATELPNFIRNSRQLTTKKKKKKKEALRGAYQPGLTFGLFSKCWTTILYDVRAGA